MPRETFPEHPPFAALSGRLITVGSRREVVAVHVAGRLSADRLPLVCVAGYTRNMTDYTDFVPLAQRALGAGWPLVLVDLRGRGRSSDRPRLDAYTTTNDARDLAEVARALAIDAAVFIGQGHGGQAVMTLAGERPALIAGAVLIDAGPVASAQSLLRLRSNTHSIAVSRGIGGLTVMMRRMLAADYPDLDNEQLDRLAQRNQRIDARGRAWPLFDLALVERFKHFTPDDVLVPQWQVFDLLTRVPTLFLRTEFTDQLPPEALVEMMQRRPDAASLVIARQGSPALLDHAEEVEAIAAFVRGLARPAERKARSA